jgi:predicted ATP-dependent serine protease
MGVRGMYMGLSESNQISKSERILNKWLQEIGENMDLVVVNNVPILIDDCLSVLKGSVTCVKDYTNKLVVTTDENRNYVFESFKLNGNI